MSLGEPFFDRSLPLQEPIHGLVKVILGSVGDLQLLGQGGAVPVSGVSQLGAGEEEAFGDHGDHQVTLWRRLGRDEFVDSEFADHCEDCFHMPVRTCACDAESLSCRDEGLALEGAFDDLDDVRGKMGEVAEGLMSDGLSLANGPSEQMGDVGLSLVDPRGRGHVYAAASCWHAAIF